MTRKHRTQASSDDLKDGAVQSADIADSTVTGTDISDKSITTRDVDAMVHGTFPGVDQTGSYIQFGSAFAGSPDVAVTGIGGETLQLSGTPVKGSFSVEASAGTVPGMFVAWGSR